MLLACGPGCHQIDLWKELFEILFLLLLFERKVQFVSEVNPLNPELNPICYLLALLAYYFLHVSRIKVKSLTLRLLMSYIYIYIWSAYS